MTNRNAQIKWLIVSGILIAISIVILFLPERQSDPDADLRNLKPGATVSKIIDGDTFELSDGRTVRLIGVDTPEIDMPFYDEAAAFTESVLIGREIDFEFDKVNSDKYGRLLLYAFVDSNFVNETIIRNGLGIVYLFESDLKYADALIESQKRARTARLGIWSLPDPALEDYYINIEGSFRFHRPLCMAIKKSDPDKWKIYYSREELLDKGFSPCRNCRP